MRSDRVQRNRRDSGERRACVAALSSGITAPIASCHQCATTGRAGGAGNSILAPSDQKLTAVSEPVRSLKRF